MNVVSQVLAGVTALALIVVGVLEIFFHGDRRFYRLFLIEPDEVPAVRMWAMNIGAYNITFALGMLAGLWLINGGGAVDAGVGIVVFCCTAQFLLGIWLWVTEKRLWMSAIGQALFPGLVVLFWLVVD